MSPAPYPPLHAGDDVDVDEDFFDQLGDELDFPAQGSVPHKQEDAGLANLGDPPGGVVSSGAGEWSSLSKVHPEESGFPELQEGNSKVDLELEDAFSNLNLEKHDAESVSHDASDTHLLSNGDDPGLHHSPEEAVHGSDDRVTGVESSVSDSIMSVTHSAEDNSVAQLGVPEDSWTSTSVPPETPSVENVESESALHGELSFSADLTAEAASIIEEAPTGTLPEDLEEVKLPGAPKVQAQTSQVEEVQWSNFGSQGGFGSFSDFLSMDPDYSSQTQEVNAVASVSEPHSFHFGQQSTLDTGLNVVEGQYDDVSFFDQPHLNEERGRNTAEEPPQPSTIAYETQAPLQVMDSGQIPQNLHPQGLEQVQGVQFDPGQWQNTQLQGQAQQVQDQWQSTQSQGQAQQVQSDQVDQTQWNDLQSAGQVEQIQYGQQVDQGLWQELAEYPGWLYNTITGEWVEKNSNVADVATASSWGYTSGQDGSQDRGAENETIQWQGNDATSNATDGNGPKDDPNLGQPTAGTSLTAWTGDQKLASQIIDSPGAVSTEAVVQQNDLVWQESTGEAASTVSQSGWEDQYPGWYWDYQAQEWKQYSQPLPVTEEEPQSTSFPAVSYGQTALPNEFSQGYNVESTSAPAVSYGQTTHANNFSQGYNVESASVPAVSYGQTSDANNFSQGYKVESTSVPAVSHGQTTHSNDFSQGYNVESTSVPAVSYGQTTHSNKFSQGYNVESTSVPAVSYGQTTHSNKFSQGYNVESTSVPAVSYGQTTLSNNFSQGYNVGWSTGQDQQYKAVGQHGQDGYGGNEAAPHSLQNDGQRSAQAQISGQWAGRQTQEFDIPASYHPSGNLMTNGTNQQSWETGYSEQQVDPSMMPENQYNPYPAAQMTSYAPQSQNWHQAPHHSSYVPRTAPKSVEEALRTSAGRPAHVLTAFAFGGKLLVMKLKDPLSLQSSDGNQSFASGQAFVPGPIQVHSLSQLVAQTSDNGRGETGSSYFRALSRPTLHGPLVGGSVSGKELNKWLDEQAVNCLSEEPNFRSSSSLPMLWGLLKLGCKHYGKLRSQSGLAGLTSQEDDGAEAALAKLLTSGGDQSSWTMGSFSATVCLRPLPSEHQLQVTATETKKLLVSGKRKEALKVAQQGQLWGPALVLARQLGEKYYADTVAAMAQRQFLPGSPLRTLSLLLAGQPAEVFNESNIVTSPRNQPMLVPSSAGNSAEGGIGSMLEEWQENLSIMAANHTNGDDRVISHLGDCLWKVKGEVAAAHICYLVADANFEAFSSNARLCLVGADHWENPRTYVTPEAIQRTEVYEYSKVLGNSQFILGPFQPYKLIYASMLAEAGKTSEALRYSQAVLKTLKASRGAEVEICRLAAAQMEERLRFHLQGGHAGNFAPTRLVQGLFGVMDRSIKSLIGGPPQPTGNEHMHMAPPVESATLQDHLGSGFFGGSPSRPLPPLGPSASAEKLKEAGGRPMPVRSVSEPDFSTSMKEKAEQGKPITRGGYLGRFGSVFSKAGGIVSMVSKTSKKEAKLGDANKFYFDEKLKRWVEEGAEAPQEEAAPPPPPISANFARKVEDASSPDAQFGVGLGAGPPASASKNTHLGTPPVPPSNQHSARARQQGVRSRYVDTFNKGGNSTTPLKSAVSSFAPAARFGAAPLQPMNIFVPASSLDSMNGSENGTSLGNSEENHTDQHSESGSNVQEQHESGMFGSGIRRVPSSENASTFGPGAIHRVPSYENTASAVTSASAQRTGRLGRSPSSGDIGLSNGFHSRANSWGGYPSNFQNSQTETNSSYENPAANFSMYNGFSSQSTMNTPPTVGSYFPSPSKGDIYNANSSAGLSESFASPPPSMIPFMPGIVRAELRPGVVETRNGSEPGIALAGDDLQEVEL